MLWDLAEGKRLYSLDAGDIIHSLVFSPNRYWLCAATQTSIKVGLGEVPGWIRPSMPYGVPSPAMLTTRGKGGWPLAAARLAQQRSALDSPLIV